MDGDDAGEVLLAAEAAAGGGLDDVDLAFLELECGLDGLVDVVGALVRAAEGDAGGVPGGDEAVGLDIDVFLGAGLVDVLEDDLAGGEFLVGVAVVDAVFLEDDALADVEDAGFGVVGDLDGAEGVLKEALVGVGEEEDGFLAVPDDAVAEDGLVGLDEDDAVVGDVLGGDNGELVPGDAGSVLDAADAAAGDGAAEGLAVDLAGEVEIIDVACGAGDLVDALLAEDGLADELIGGTFDRHVVRHSSGKIGSAVAESAG